MAYKACIKYFKALNQLQKSIFACYIQKDYLLNQYLYRQQIHRARLKLLTTMKKMRSIARLQNKIVQLENLYEIVFSLNILKLHVIDHTTFDMCIGEFKKISEGLSSTLQHIILFLERQGHPRTKIVLENGRDQPDHPLLHDAAKIFGGLSHKIDELEELYRSTLQVAARDPIFFLFFVQDLIALRDMLESFLLGLMKND